jgi:hypothetical protein
LLFAEETWTDLSLLWDLSPNDPSRVVLNSNSISLLPGDKRLELLISTPKERGYVMQSEVDYNPTVATEVAGNTLRSITDNYIDLEIRGDTSELCKYMKITVDDDAILNAKCSMNGSTWIDYGNTKVIDMNKIGYYIEAGTSVTPFNIKKCIMYKSNSVLINNFDRTNVLKLFDSTGHEVTDKFVIKKKNTQMSIDGTNVVFPIDYLKVQSCDRVTGTVYYEAELTDIYGGDVYEYTYNVDFFINENVLTSAIYDLGLINQDQIFVLKISNKESFPLNDRKLRVSYYTIYNPGYKLAQLAEDGSLDFETELDVTLGAGETKIYQLKAIKDNNIVNIEDEYKFNIVLE